MSFNKFRNQFKTARNAESKTVTFLDVQVNHITKDVGHINNKVLPKNGSKIVNFSLLQAVGKGFFDVMDKCKAKIFGNAYVCRA